MSHRTQITRTWGLVLALALALALAVPAGATGRVDNQPLCPPTTGEAPPPRVAPDLRPPCVPRDLAGDRQGLDGAHVGLLTGGIAMLVLAVTGGMVVATRRADASASPGVSYYAELEALWLLPAREVEHDA